MIHTPQEQPKKEAAQKAQHTKDETPKTSPEVPCSPHDILGKEYEFNGASFIVLGMEPMFHDNSKDDVKDLPLNIVAIVNVRKQRVPVIPFSGGMVRITKIQMNNEVIADSIAILKRLRISIDLLQVDKETGIYIDSQGRKWMSVPTLAEYLGVTPATIRKSIRKFNISSIQGRDRISHPALLYSFTDAYEKLKDYIIHPQVDKKTGIYTDIKGNEWMTKESLAAHFSISGSKLARYTLSSIMGRDMRGCLVQLASLTEAQKILNEHIISPQVDKDTGIYIDHKGVQWTTEDAIATLLNISSTTLKQCYPISSIKGRDKSGSLRQLFKITDAQEKFKDFLSLPRVNKETGIYTDLQGQEWAVENTLIAHLGTYLAKLKRCYPITSIPGRDRSGHKVRLMNICEAEEKMNKV